MNRDCGFKGSLNVELGICECDEQWANAIEFSYVIVNHTFTREAQPCTFNQNYLRAIYSIAFFLGTFETILYASQMTRWSQLRRNSVVLSGHILFAVAVGIRIFDIRSGFGVSRAFGLLWAVSHAMYNSGVLLFVGRYVSYRNKIISSRAQDQIAKHEDRRALWLETTMNLLGSRWATRIMCGVLLAIGTCFAAASEILISIKDDPLAVDEVQRAHRFVLAGLCLNLVLAIYGIIAPFAFLESFVHDLSRLTGKNAPKDESVDKAVKRIKFMRKLFFPLTVFHLLNTLLVLVHPLSVSLWSYFLVFFAICSFLIGNLVVYTYSSNRRKTRQTSTRGRSSRRKAVQAEPDPFVARL